MEASLGVRQDYDGPAVVVVGQIVPPCVEHVAIGEVPTLGEVARRASEEPGGCHGTVDRRVHRADLVEPGCL